MKSDKEMSNAFIFILIMLVIAGVVFAIVIAPYAIMGIGGYLESSLDPNIAITLFIFAILFVLLFSFYAMIGLQKRKSKASTRDDVNSGRPKMFGKYDKNRDYFERRINELSEQLVSTQKRWEEAYHLVVSSSAKSDSNSGKISSNEFLSKYGIDPDEITIDERLVFILTPYSENSIGEFLTIRTACNESGLLAVRGDEESISGEIFAHIIRSIAKSQLVIANINGRNPNVFYELGIAHMMNKPTILVSRMGEAIPFDILPKRVILYGSAEELRVKLREALRPFSKEIDNISYDNLQLSSVSEVANRVKEILRVYREYPPKKQQVIEMLRPIFSANSEARRVVTDGNRFRASFVKRLGKSNMLVLRRLLLLLDKDYYESIDFSVE